MLDHAFGAERPVHARRRRGVHAPRRRDVRPRPAHRHRARRGAGPRARAAHQLRADAVGARGRDAGLPHARGRRSSSSLRIRALRDATSRARRACASARPARIRSRSSSAQRITAKDRYRAIVDQMQYIARRELIFGMHVHVAVDDPEKAIQVVNALIAHLARARRALGELAVLARRADRASRSSRHMVFAAFPRSGPPPRFRDYADYAQVVNQLEKTGCIQDYTHIWWDIRLHPRLGTIEIRICDARDAARGRDRDHRVLPGARQALRGARRRAARRSRRSTASSRPRTSGSPRATGSRRR